MDVELVGRMLSTLPEDDEHPYRTGPWRPQTAEWRADDLEVVQGGVPTDLDGVYLRNTENPLHPALKAYHPFDGDGMVHVLGFRDGTAFYRNRFVRTEGLLAEAEAGRSLWAGVSEPPAIAMRDDGWGARGGMKDASSTDVVVHRGVALTSFYQCGDLYRLDPRTGDPLGRASWGGRFPAWGVSAHPKVDPVTGELLFFSYAREAPYLRWGAVDATDTLTHLTDVELPGPRMPHDMAYTTNYVVLNDFPLFWDEQLAAQGAFVPRFHRDLPSRFAVVPRAGGPVRWFEASPTFVLHFVGAWEEGDEIVLDGFYQDDPEPGRREGDDHWMRAFRFLALDRLQTHLHRWRFDLRTGAVREERLSDSLTEFGTRNESGGAVPHRYVYAATGPEGKFLFDGLVKHDVVAGTEERIVFGDGVFGSETHLAPRVGSTREDDGYLVTLTTSTDDDASYGVVYAADDLAAGPVCTLRLPERISSGTHATWVAGEELRRWDDADGVTAPAALGL
ncbi:carotenoid oxygenase family protein [Lapillicoccus jejuensis]|uniref:Dioxygenase n=1 Tax=Lapillicoccus jejuensis TaxID=402171 RepID=A0A542DYU2_9MICO|nr:carotenoid oxygenase family protein [Lapillicoccus jejuensis]TQJ08219.1 carotenoid cleavage dioxygenase [Lapillicoccus jejuensis]